MHAQHHPPDELPDDDMVIFLLETVNESSRGGLHKTGGRFCCFSTILPFSMLLIASGHHEIPINSVQWHHD